MVLLSFFKATTETRLCCKKKKKKKLTARNGKYIVACSDVEIFFFWDLKCRVNINLTLSQ